MLKKSNINKFGKIMLKYILIFIISVIILLSLLVLTALIPKSAIEENLKESVSFYKEHSGIEELLKRRDYTFIHYYADSMILNIINSIDSNKPLESVIRAKYYETIKIDTNYDFIKSVNEDLEPNQQYMRYWHGSMVILRPMLTIFNIEQIYLFNKIVLAVLATTLLILLFRRNKSLAIIYLISMVMIVFPIVPYCLEYTWTFYIMLITSIIAISIEKKGDKELFILFYITGILTCFFDFLSTEIITIFIPILLILAIRKKENRISGFKETLVFILKSSILWGTAYVGMWFAKWGIATIILKVNAIEYVKDYAILRINGLQGLESDKEMYLGALYRNFHNLYPLNIIKKISDLWIYVGIFFIVVLATFDWKNIKEKWFSLLMLTIGIMPYIRYLILANHSYRHSFFTFRSQIITIIAILLIILDCFNYKIWFKRLKIKN